jgi:starch synthase
MESEPLRILYAASEYAPLCKTGGLGDVAKALPRALSDLGADVRVLLPGYRDVLSGLQRPRHVARLGEAGEFPQADLFEADSPSKQRLLVLACPELFERAGGPYVDPDGNDWPDNALRFGFFSYTAAALAGPSSPYNWRCDVLHCNDWQTGLAAAYRYWRRPPRIPCLMTIHSLAYQGIFPPSMVPRLGLPAQCFDVNGIEYYGNMSFLKAGLFYAQRISTVSTTYAQEIQHEPLGFGLHGLLSGRKADLEGVLNGIDTEIWDPLTDAALTATYGADSLERKTLNTHALRGRFGLEQRPDLPLLGIVSRLIPQKGVDLVVAAAERIAQLPAQVVVLGSGEPGIERRLSALAGQYQGRIGVERRFDESLSHLVEAGADIFLMPSRFEPCGLNQMYSQRYGTPPIVRRTGGLADSVVDCSAQTLANGTASGFVFNDSSAEALLAAISRALDVWRNTHVWRQVQRNGMRRDFSWGASARRYLELYHAMRTPA